MTPITHTCTSLPPSVARLVDRGVLERAELGDGARDDAPGRALVARARAELTAGQASALVALLGLGGAAPANDGAP